MFYFVFCSILFPVDKTFTDKNQLEKFVQKLMASDGGLNHVSIENGFTVEKIATALVDNEQIMHCNKALKSIEQCDHECYWNLCTYIICASLRRYIWDITSNKANKSATVDAEVANIEADVADKLIRFLRALASVFNIFGAELLKEIAQNDIENLVVEILSSFSSDQELEEAVLKMNALVKMGGHQLLNGFVEAINRELSLTELGKKFELIEYIFHHPILSTFNGSVLNKRNEKCLALFNVMNTLSVTEMEMVFTVLNNNYSSNSDKQLVSRLLSKIIIILLPSFSPYHKLLIIIL